MYISTLVKRELPGTAQATAADHLLNQAYQSYMRLNDADNRKLKTKAELAWIAFRDVGAIVKELESR